MPKRWVALFICLLVTLQVSAQSDTPLFETSDCLFDRPVGYEIICGTVTVPESRDPAAAGDTSIPIAVAVFKSRSAVPQDDPVIYLHGGPGGRSLESLAGLISIFDPFLQDRDVIFFDQRGVGYSGALDCPEYAAMGYEVLALDLDQEELVRLSNQALLDCHDRLVEAGVDLAVYTSAASAADVRDLVMALGYEKVNLLGISYGTRLALTVMRDYPDLLRSVILDAVVPLEVSPNTEIIANADRVFQTVFDACARDSACRDTYPDLETVFYETVERLNTRPEIETFFDGFTNEARDILVTGDLLIYGLFDLLYYSEEIQNLPAYIFAAQDGYYDPFVLDTLYTLADSGSFDEGVYVAIQCNEEVPFDPPVSLTTLGDGFPQALTDLYGPDVISTGELCAAWDSASPDPAENEAVNSDLPTLVMVGEFDPVTPPAWARLAADSLPNSYFYELPSLGHATIGSNCALDMMLEFVADPTLPPDSSCIARIPPPLFAIGPITSVNNQPFSSDVLGFSALVPEGWFEIEAGLYSPYPALGNPVLAYRFPESIEQYVSDIIINGIYQYDSLPEPVDVLDIDGRSWQIYQVEQPELEIYGQFAFYDDRETSYVIALVAASEAERDFLYEALLVPTLEAFTPLD